MLIPYHVEAATTTAVEEAKSAKAPNNKHQKTNKLQATSTKIQTRTNFQATNLKQAPNPEKQTSFISIRGQAQGQRSAGPPRLEFAVLPFGPCLDLGACDLYVFRDSMFLSGPKRHHRAWPYGVRVAKS
jgi:hypothetical protein